MKRVILFVVVLVVVISCTAETYRAATHGQSLLFSVPEGWRRANEVEMLGLSAGLKMADSENSVFSAVVLPDVNKGGSASKSLMTLVFIDEVSDKIVSKELMEEFGERLKRGLKEQAGQDEVVNNLFKITYDLEMFETHESWLGCWLSNCMTIKRRGKENLQKTKYTYWGLIALGGRAYGIQASSSILDNKEKVAFKAFVYNWMRTMVDLNKEGLPVRRIANTNFRADSFWSREALRLTSVQQTEHSVRGRKDSGLLVRFKSPYSFELPVDKLNDEYLYMGYNNVFTAHTKKLIAFSILLGEMPDEASLMLNFLSELDDNLTDKKNNDLFLQKANNYEPALRGSRIINGRNCIWITLKEDKQSPSSFTRIRRSYFMKVQGLTALCFSFVISDGTDNPSFKEFEDIFPLIDMILKSVSISGVPGKSSKAQEENSILTGGTGWYVNSNHVVTCWHVVRNALNPIIVTEDGTEVKIELAAKDEINDIAIMKVCDRHFRCEKPLVLSGKEAQVSEKIFTVGYPQPDVLGVEPKYTTGVISALSGIRGDASQYQITTPIQPGNSGGALVDEYGEVVGIVQNTLDTDTFISSFGITPQNVNYGIKIKYLRELMKKSGVIIPDTDKTKRRKLQSQDAYLMSKDATVLIISR